MSISVPVPERYQRLFTQTEVVLASVVAQQVSQRQAVIHLWKCKTCGKTVSQNAGAAYSHWMSHVRRIERMVKR